MKTSNYILISFLSFIAFTLIGWHIDSKLHEEEYDYIKKVRSDFYSTRTWLQNNTQTPEKGKEFIKQAEEYFKYYNGSFDYASAASLQNHQFIMFKDTSSLELAKKWIDKAYKLKPDNRYINETYAITLQNLGLNEEAKLYFDKVKRLDSLNGFKYVEYKDDKGETIKVRKLIEVID